MIVPRGFFTRLMAGLFLFLSAAEVCVAAEWWWTPVVRMDAEYNDNISLSTQPRDSTRRTLITPSVNFGVESTAWTVNGRAEYQRQDYSNIENHARDSQNYAVSTRYSTERSVWSLSGGQSYSSSFVSQPGTTESEAKRRKSSSFSPSWSWSMTELTQLQLSYQKTSVTHEDGVLFGLSNYDSSGLTTTLTKSFSSRTSGFVTLGASLYEAPTEPFESKGRSAKLGTTHAFSDTLSATFSVGAQRTKSEGFVRPADICTNEPIFTDPVTGGTISVLSCIRGAPEFVSQDKTTTLYSALIKKSYDVAEMTLALGRSLIPSSVGTLTRADSLALNIRRPLTALLAAHLSFTAYDFQSVLGGVAGDDRRFYQLSPSLRYQFSEKWNLETKFRYSRMNRDNDLPDAQSRAVLLALSYTGPKWSFSR